MHVRRRIHPAHVRRRREGEKTFCSRTKGSAKVERDGEGRERNRETLGRKTHRLPTIVDAPRTLVAQVAVGGVGSDDGDAPRPDHQRAISMRLFRV